MQFNFINFINFINLFNLVNSSSHSPLTTSSCVTAPSNSMESKDGWVCLTGGSNETYVNNSCVVINSDNDPSYHCLNESSWCVTEGEGERCYPIDNEFRHDFSVPEDVCDYINDGSWWICSQPTADNSYSLIGGNYTCDATGTVETVEMDNGECSKTPSPSPDDGSSDDDSWAELGKYVGVVAGVSVGAIILCTLYCNIKSSLKYLQVVLQRCVSDESSKRKRNNADNDAGSGSSASTLHGGTFGGPGHGSAAGGASDPLLPGPNNA